MKYRKKGALPNIDHTSIKYIVIISILTFLIGLFFISLSTEIVIYTTDKLSLNDYLNCLIIGLLFILFSLLCYLLSLIIDNNII